MKNFIQLFSSIKLALFLIILIILACILGTLIPQHRETEFYQTKYGGLAGPILALHLSRLYSSWWFIGLLFLFSLNLIVCTLKRFFPKLRRFQKTHPSFVPVRMAQCFFSETCEVKGSLDNTSSLVRRELKNRHFRIRYKQEDDTVFFSARKKISGRFGAEVVHLGLLIILAGGIISGISGFSSNLILKENQTAPVPKANFKIRLDSFQTEFYPDGSPKDWKSTLSIIRNEQVELQKTIEVNHPLSYDGFVFYQNSYGWDWDRSYFILTIDKPGDKKDPLKIRVRRDETYHEKSSGLTLSLSYFVPDFVIDQQNRIQSRSNLPRNPAVYIQGEGEKEGRFSGWLFARFPDFKGMHFSKETGLNIRLTDLFLSHYSVIQAARDPGVNTVWVGCGIVMAGLLLAFYWPAREILIILASKEGRTTVTAGMIASKQKDAAAKQLKDLISSLRSNT
ncbi:MAG: cytochrome c biogenesis protein ResB [Candidatus Aminicenantes bacterium]|nr:cytochrome c biogenesis protein ResB [Candidatus Aminicenantes bacterium]